jgi:AcrR family transcriptional regulator
MDTSSTRLTPKGERTREHILDTALDLFIRNGYHSTTMREIATTADCSLGLTYRYFARKEDLVIALYRRLAQELEEHVAALAPAALPERFAQIMRLRLRQIQPYRELFQSILGAAMSPQNELGILGTQTSDVRSQEQNAFLMLVQGATDAPRGAQTQELARVLYAAHMCLLLFWFYDRSPDCRTSDELLVLAHDVLKLVQRFLRVRPFARTLTRLSNLIEPVFGPGDNEGKQTSADK